MYTLKKSFGQHFLNDENICREIVSSLPVQPGDQVLEIGPGGGAITKYLLAIPDITFKAVELDREKVVYLEHTFPEIAGKLIEKDFLKLDKPYEGSFKVIGNFPYNISTQIMFKIIDWESDVPDAVGMFQKEVAQRICSGPGSKVYGILSVITQAYYKTEYLFDVHENSFTPPPKVKSGVIRLSTLNNPHGISDKRAFIHLVKMAFGQRRKTLRNCLKGMYSAEQLKDVIFDKRAEQLSVADFVGLHRLHKGE